MVIEFIGPEGSGKSTAITLLSRALPKQGLRTHVIDANRLSELQLRTGEILSIVRNLYLTGWCSISIRRGRVRRRHNPSYWRVLSGLCGRDALIRDLPKASLITLLDEGPRHRLIGLAAAGKLRNNKRIFGALTEPDIVVFLEVAPEVALCRLRQKGCTHWAHAYDDAWLLDRLERYTRIARKLLPDVRASLFRYDSSDGNRVVTDLTRRIVKSHLDCFSSERVIPFRTLE